MWQRIQTVFLAIIIISFIATLFFPIWAYEEPGGQTQQLYPLHYTIIVDGTHTTQYFPYTITAVLAIAAATLAFIEIRKYKNRLLQMKLGALNSLFMMGTILSAIIFSNQLIKIFPMGHYSFGLWLPGLGVVCNLLANRFIRRDEKLVRDSERLR